MQRYIYITDLSPIIPKGIPWSPRPRIWWRTLGGPFLPMPTSPYLSWSDKSHLIAPTPEKARKPLLLRSHPSVVGTSSLSHVGIESPAHVYSVTWSRMPNAGCRVRSVSPQERGQGWTHAHPMWAWLGQHALVTCGSPARIHIDSGLCFLIKGFIALEETWDQGV